MPHRRKTPAWKRSLDLFCTLISLPCWLPLMVLLTLWIKLVSRGPVFYVQERVGYRGKKFMLYKFRSMKLGAETGLHARHMASLIRSNRPMTKLDHLGDARLIPLGRFIRATGFDELPQILNILRGEMSLVGPRPCGPSEVEDYECWHFQRFNAPPGLTGSWQVNGKNQTTFDEMVKFDIDYTKRCSFWMDVKIILRTPLTIFQQVFVSVEPEKITLPSDVTLEKQGSGIGSLRN